MRTSVFCRTFAASYLLQTNLCQLEYSQRRFITTGSLLVSLVDGEELDTDILAKSFIMDFLVRMLCNPLGIEVLDDLLSYFNIFFGLTYWYMLCHFSSNDETVSSLSLSYKIKSQYNSISILIYYVTY